MRKVLALLLASALAFSVMLTPAAAAGTQRVYGENVTAGPGDTFEYPVYIENNQGIVAATVTLTWQTNVLSLEEIKFNGVMPNDGTKPVDNTENTGRQTIVLGDALAQKNYTDNGLLFTAVFRVNGEATPGVRTIQVFGTYGDSGFVNFDLETVHTEFSSGTVTIVGAGTEPSPDPEPEPESEPIAFTDTENHWSKEFVAEAVKLGIFKGYTDGTFRPDKAVTRGQFVTVLYRMAGSPEVSEEAPFTDIAGQSEEFRRAISWAYSKGYVNGKGEGKFAPDAGLTREEAMKILFGYNGGAPGMEMMFYSIYDGNFTDSSKLHSWARAGMYWGVYREMISGVGGNRLDPTGTITRGQVAKILVIYNEKFN